MSYDFPSLKINTRVQTWGASYTMPLSLVHDEGVQKGLFRLSTCCLVICVAGGFQDHRSLKVKVAEPSKMSSSWQINASKYAQIVSITLSVECSPVYWASELKRLFCQFFQVRGSTLRNWNVWVLTIAENKYKVKKQITAGEGTYRYDNFSKILKRDSGESWHNSQHNI